MIVNGKSYSFDSPITLIDLLKTLGYDHERVACEVDSTLVKRSDYHTFVLRPESKVEVFQFVGGG